MARTNDRQRRPGRGRGAPRGQRRAARAVVRRGQWPALRLDRLDAVLFGLDGVLTCTAGLHEAAWTAVFTELFEGVSAATRERPCAMFLNGCTQSADGGSVVWAAAVPRSRAGRGR